MPMLAGMAVDNPEYLSDAFTRPAAMVAPAAGPSPSNSDQAAFETLLGQLVQAQDILLRWLRDPSAVADDETDAPSPEAIRKGLAFTNRLRYSLANSPESRRIPLVGVTVGSAGSISIDFAEGTLATTIRFFPDGLEDALVFVRDQLIGRHVLAPG